MKSKTPMGSGGAARSLIRTSIAPPSVTDKIALKREVDEPSQSQMTLDGPMDADDVKCNHACDTVDGSLAPHQ